MVSIKDVAERANVAKSTVSLVINNNGYVSEQTREKVEKAMRELKYVPNQLAKNLSSRKSNLIGIVMPDILHPFFSTFIKHVEKELYEKGYMTMVCGSVGRNHVEKEYIEWLNRSTMDGIIMGAHSLDISHYVGTDRPIVSLDRFLNERIPMVSSNHHQAAELTIERLESSGCTHAVQFVGSRKYNLGSDTYVDHCKRMFEEKGYRLDFFEMDSNTFTLEQYMKAASTAMDKYKGADAFIGSDLVISQCLKIAMEKGIRVPDDLKLIAFDGTYVTRITSPVITAIVQPIEKLASLATDALIDQINGKPIREHHMILDVYIQEGETTL
ncbi:LacI family DNA-binding transcriptional regulator (plasmid) [Rossellomorea sp. FS2]|uniref:LacI family DNA-binding transcriptional regulator n=1 Tax=Rossellomorea sp. FS2 TaxID=3391447 RepID=UPI003A4D5D17